MSKPTKTTNLSEVPANEVRDQTLILPTWHAIVLDTLVGLGGTASLASIDAIVGNHPKARNRPFWRQQVRLKLESSSVFVRVGNGMWSLSSKWSPENIAKFQRLRRERWPLLGPRKRKTIEP
jgi:hypothetical protein